MTRPALSNGFKLLQSERIIEHFGKKIKILDKEKIFETINKHIEQVDCLVFRHPSSLAHKDDMSEEIYKKLKRNVLFKNINNEEFNLIINFFIHMFNFVVKAQIEARLSI